MFELRVRSADSLVQNSIGDEGARALAESLKQNTTLTELNLEGTWIIVCSCVTRSS